MGKTQIEYPAYNIFFRQAGRWTLYGEPIIGKPYIEAECVAVGIIIGNPLTDAVRIYGVFNCQQSLIKEITKSELSHESEEDKMRSAIKEAIAICDEAITKGVYVRDGASIDFARIKNLLTDVKDEQVQADIIMTEQEG